MKPSVCPCCGDGFIPGPDSGHHPMTIDYKCPDCGDTWEDDWCSAVDGECPTCGSTIEPESWAEWGEEQAA